METSELTLTVAGRTVPTPCDRIGAGPDALLLPALWTISARAQVRGLGVVYTSDGADEGLGVD